MPSVRRLLPSLRERLVGPPLPEGETAPSWRLCGHDGESYALTDKWTLLAFTPLAATEEDEQQLRELEAHREALAALGCRIFAVSTLVPERVDRRNLGFPLLVDQDGAVARQYRAFLEIPLLPRTVVRTTYLVNPARKIRLANRGAPSVAAIVRSVQALKTATRAGM